ncbi:GNAT family N-acetyltransferase [Rhodanobacter ginsengisoli]|uniref:GNAT family N-acetyltransferase n=1 Tax=Rhodanobacter ginsengisoli TaxID=418646 RepID=A0ABW0QHP1_9GAMM
MALEIRKAKRSDLHAMLEMMHEHARFERSEPPNADESRLVEAIFRTPRLLCAWIALVDDKSVGYMTATREFSTWRAAAFMHMDCLYVRADYRGMGIGVRLIAALRDFCAGEGIDQVQWQTPGWNRDAARFYRRLGAKQCTKRRFTWQIDPRQVIRTLDEKPG